MAAWCRMRSWSSDRRYSRVSGFVIRAAGLEDIIRAKERADRDKDRDALPELRRLRDASTDQEGDPS